MRWEVINLPKEPECMFCHRSSEQMARFVENTNQYLYICSDCGRYVKDCMNKWKDIPDRSTYIST